MFLSVLLTLLPAPFNAATHCNGGCVSLSLCLSYKLYYLQKWNV